MPGRVAARSMAWYRRMGGTAGPLSASGESSNGDPVQVELYINGSWVDITSYVMVRDNSGNIAITRGRRDEGASTEQSTCQLLLDNRDGRWSPRYPDGAYFGYIGRNQPLRVSVPDGLGGKNYRFQGEVSAWPQMWDPTGTDIWTEIDASGIIRRLSQAPIPAISSMRNALLNPLPTGIQAYWPMEDAEGAVSFASGLPTGLPMTYTGTPEMASYTGFPSSDPLADLTASVLTGPVVSYATPSATQVRFLCFIPSDGILDLTSLCTIAQEDYGSIVWFDLWYSTSTNSLTLGMVDGDGSFHGVDLPGTYDVRGKSMYISIELVVSGGNVIRTLRIYDLATGTTNSVSDTTVAQLTRVTELQFGAESHWTISPEGLSSVIIGHVTVENAITSMTALGVALNPIGEAAGSRIQRLCSENSIAFDSIGTLTDSPAMGEQSKSSPLTLIREAEDADGGMLYESMATLGLGYRTRNSLCNQDPALTLSYTGFNLAEIPAPVEDDRFIQNQVNVTVGGVSASYSLSTGTLSIQNPPTGVGVYGSDITLNLKNTNEAQSQAAWRVHLGTVDEPRYPQISVNLSHSSFTNDPALKRAVLNLRQGDRILVQNLPFWLPPGDIDQIVLGFEETITHFEHKITFICAPASPYQVGVLDAPTARIDTDGSALLAAAGTLDDELTVSPSTEAKTLWTTNSTYFPFDLKVDGEVVTATSISSYVYDSFTRTESGAWGTSDSSQTWGVVGGTVATDFTVTSGYATHILTSVDTSRRSSIDFLFPDVDVTVKVTTSATATGGSLYGGPVVRYVDANNLYMLRIEFTTANAINLDLRKRVASTETSIATYSTTLTHVAGTFINSRLQAYGTKIRAKVWSLTETEPHWQISTTDTSITTANFVGCRSISAASNTNVSPQVRYDEFDVHDPQTFVVTRSVNGVVQAHAVGAAIRLNDPTIISL